MLLNARFLQLREITSSCYSRSMIDDQQTDQDTLKNAVGRARGRIDPGISCGSDDLRTFRERALASIPELSVFRARPWWQRKLIKLIWRYDEEWLPRREREIRAARNNAARR